MRNLIHAWRDWWLIGVLALLCAILSLLQYRWTGEASEAERQRMRASIDLQLRQWKRGFDTELGEAMMALTPRAAEIELQGREAAHRVRRSETQMFSRVGVAVPKEGAIELFLLTPRDGSLAQHSWPGEWRPFREQFEARSMGGFRRRAPFADESPSVIERPIFGEEGAEIEWMIFDLDREYLRGNLIPELNRRFLNVAEDGGYDVEIRSASDLKEVIYSTRPGRAMVDKPDSELEVFGSFGGGGGPRGPGPRDRGERKGPPPGKGRPDEHGRWILAVQHRAGSVDAAVAQARWRNLTVELLLLGLILLAGYSLVRTTIRARRLAETQLRFVAGVSHELRTPLTVIRGAGHNLMSGVVKDKDHIERYARMIVQHSEHLTEIIEQVLAFASTREKRKETPVEAVSIAETLERAVEATATEVEAAGCKLEMKIAEGLPPVMGDAVALRRAFQNLIANAAKHGADGKWIGIEASLTGGDKPSIEITVGDHGQGIPKEELDHIFDPFYRGERARLDQIRGTGLGLSLIREIASAHGGKISAGNGEHGGARFTILIPAATVEQYDEFAHTSG